MFQNDYQGGPYFEVFSAQGKDTISKWKVVGSASAVKKVYDKDVKSYVVVVEGGSATTRIQMPKDNKISLLLIQRYLVLQLMVPLGQDFSIELSIIDMGNNKRRLFLSSAQKEISITPLHAKIPLSILRRGVWVNLCLDMISLVSDVFKGQTLKFLDSLTIAANCRLRRVFTMKNQPPDTTDDDEQYDCQTTTNTTDIDSIPRTCQFGPDVQHLTQVLTMHKIKQADMKLKGEVFGMRPISTTDPDLGASQKAKNADVPMHIAFGSKVPVPSISYSKKPSSSSSAESGSRTSRSTHSRIQGVEDLSQSLSGSKSLHSHVDSGNDVAEQTELLTARGFSSENTALKPHPPREKSSERTRRFIRVRGKKGGGDTVNEPSDDTDTTAHRVNSGDSAHRMNSGDAAHRMNSGDTAHRINSGDAAHRINSGEVAQRVNSGDAAHRVSSGDKSHRVSSAEKSHRIGSGEMANRHGTKSNRDDSKHSKTEEDNSLSHRIGSGEQRKRNNPVQIERISNKNGPRSDTGGASRKNDENSVHINGNGDVTNEDRSSHIIMTSENGQETNFTRDTIYTFMSPPRTAPPRKDKFHLGVNHKTIVTNMKNEVAALRESQQALLVSRGARPEEDFYGNEEEEETNTREKIVRRSPSPRAHQRTPSPESPEVNRLQVPLQQVMIPDGLSTPGTSQSRLSISSKKVREIPKDDARLSAVSPTRASSEYDWRKYASPNSSLSESFEANMLASLKRQQLEEMLEDDDDRKADHISSNDLNQHNYGDDDLSSSSDDTSFSTWRGPAPAMLAHHYQDEMHLPSSIQGDTLFQSNPREWSNAFSPPIVLPSEQMKTVQQHNAALALKSPLKDDSRKDDSGKGESDGEEELELLYDPCLNCYFDPKSCKYYELV
ncbi:protein CFAP20DC-like [Glandiceps talaboti]